MNITLTRRDIATGLLAIAGAGVAPFLAEAQSDQTKLQLTLPPSTSRSTPTFEIFKALSQIVLLRSDLDIPTAQKYFDLFLGEPWGGKHIANAYAILREAMIARNEAGGGATIGRAPLPAGERWFISHLITTWYVGVYYHPERPAQWVTLGNTMMYDAVRGLLPKRYRESIGFGKWASPPEPAKPR